MLDDVVRPALHAYLATVARKVDCECFRVGGVADHVHLAVRLSRTATRASLIEELKTSSSRWLKTQTNTASNTTNAMSGIDLPFAMRCLASIGRAVGP